MGYNTTYIGHFDITPPLNAVEVQWLEAFAAWHGGPHGDPFRVPMNPRAEWERAMKAAGGSVVLPAARDVPWGVFDWRPCPDGCCLSWHRQDRSNDALLAIRFLLDHGLGPRALARDVGGDDFSGFTFDHALDGAVAGVRADTDELFLIRAVDGRLSHETVIQGSDPYAEMGWV